MKPSFKRLMIMAGLILAINAAFSVFALAQSEPGGGTGEGCTAGECSKASDCTGQNCVCWPNPFCSPGCCNE